MAKTLHLEHYFNFITGGEGIKVSLATMNAKL